MDKCSKAARVLLRSIKRSQLSPRQSLTWQPSRRRMSSGPSASERSGPKKASGWVSTLMPFATGAIIGALGYTVGYQASVPATQPTSSTSESPSYANKEDLKKAVQELESLLGEDAVSTDDEDLKAHGYSEWSSINIDQLPVVVVYPKSTEEVSKIAQVATKYKCPMVPFSGGSSLEANFSAPFGGISIDFAFMDEVLAVHEDDMDVVVQPSVAWMDLNDRLKPLGLFFPVDPGPTAKIGGMIGTGCSGTNAFRYGTMKDWVLNMTVVLPDGKIIKTRHRPRKSSAGYNLNGIFVGAEGTLGIVTEATLKLAVVPEITRVGVVNFPNMRDAASAAMQVIRSGVPVAAMEILDDVQMMVLNKAGSTGRKWEERATLIFKFTGTQASVHDNIQSVTRISSSNKGGKLVYAKDDGEAHDLWKARKDSLWSMLSLRREGDEVWSTDVGVPISRLPDIVEISKKEIDELGLFSSILGHIGDGNFHAAIMYNRQDPEERKRVEQVVESMVDRAIAMEGTCTGEHGIGLGKKGSLVKEVGLGTIDVMRSFKRSIDPHWLMNPGKIFDAVASRVIEDNHTVTAATTLTRPSDKH